MQKLRKSVDTNEKSAFILVEFPSLEVICLKLAKIYLSKLANICGRVYGGKGEGGEFAPPNYANWGSYIVIIFQQMTFKLNSLTNLKTLFPAKLTDFPLTVHVKS